jgi:hypothetical protein
MHPVDQLLEAISTATIAGCDAWADDAVLDATVPGWRFTCQGPAAIRVEYGKWFADVGHFETVRRESFAGGEVVEYLLVWEEHGVPHAAHHLHLIDVADGRIVRDTVMCGGRWSADLLAQMEVATSA